MAAPRHFLTLLDFSPDELQQIIARAIEMKRDHQAGHDQRPFVGKVLAMVFEKSSTRKEIQTRVFWPRFLPTCRSLSKPWTRTAWFSIWRKLGINFARAK